MGERIVITKEEATRLKLKGARSRRRLETIHLKPKTHQDKRTKRRRTRRAKIDDAIKESE